MEAIRWYRIGSHGHFIAYRVSSPRRFERYWIYNGKERTFPREYNSFKTFAHDWAGIIRGEA